MPNRKPTSKKRDELRKRAEKLLDEQPDKLETVSREDIRTLIHELSVYQMELEIQNEELRNAQAELEISRDKYYGLYDFAPVGYFTLDKQGLILEANRTGGGLINKDERRLKGKPFTDFVDRDHDFYSHLNKILETKVKQNCQLSFGPKGDPRFNVHLESMPILDEEGNVAQILSAVVDMTRRKQAEKELEDKGESLRRARDELEMRVFERTAELREANVKLEAEILERKRAEEEATLYARKLEVSNRELQDFAFAASHDLQEPLRKIQSFGDLLQKEYGESLGAKAKDFLQRMQSAAARMSSLIKGLLNYSRVATKAQPFALVDLNRAAREALSNLEVSLQRSRAVLEIDRLLSIEADYLQMTQLFQNLIGNAIKFTRDGILPKVKVYSRLNEDRVELNVEDNGIGFKEEYAERIFSPFEKLHGMAEYEGVGMGLAICRKIVERHGGKISARSSPGKGATFTVVLPVKQQPQS
jgi:signal transduction histidine kinase